MTVVTSRPSRAWVHSDCSVYIALPSASRLTTWRSGQATAAPVASGHAHADRAAGEREPVVPGGAGGGAGGEEARRCGPRRPRSRPRAAARRRRRRPSAASRSPVGDLGPAGGREQRRRRPARRAASARAASGADRRRRPGGEHVDLAALGHEVARLVRVGEERHRRPGVDEHQVAEPAELHRRRTRRGRPSRSTAGRPAPRSRRAGNVSAEQLGAGGAARSRLAATQAPLAQRPCRRAAARPARRERSDLGHVGDRGRRRRWPAASGPTRRGRPARRRTTTRRRAGSAWRPGPGGPQAAATASAASPADVLGPGRGPEPAGHVARPTVSMSDSSGASYCLW